MTDVIIDNQVILSCHWWPFTYKMIGLTNKDVVESIEVVLHHNIIHNSW